MNWLKTTTYGVMHFIVAVLVAYVLTRDIAVALSVGILEPMVQTVAYTLHERIWARKGGPQAKSALACRHAAPDVSFRRIVA